MARKLIKDVGVELDSPDVKKCKSVEDIAKLELFSHLSKEEQNEANNEVFKELFPNG